MRISIIVVNWNGRRWLEQCLTSIVNQDISEEFEIIFVDNGSMDDSVKYVHDNFRQISVIALDRNYGFAQGNNIGLEKAEGEYLVFINTDTKVRSDWLRNLVKSADQNPAYEILCSIQLPLMKNEIPVIGHFFGITLASYPNMSEDIVESNFADGGCFLIRRKWLSIVGYLFDASYFGYSEDTDLSLRTILAGGKIGYVKKSRVQHFVGGSQHSSSWACRTDMVNSLRNIQKLFSGGNYRRILLTRGLFVLLIFCRAPNELRINVGRLTGFIEFLIYRKSFLKRDGKFRPIVIEEGKILRKIRYTGQTGRLIKKFLLFHR